MIRNVGDSRTYDIHRHPTTNDLCDGNNLHEVFSAHLGNDTRGNCSSKRPHGLHVTHLDSERTRKKPMTVMTNFVMVRGMPDIRFPMMTNTHGPVTDSTGLETTARVSLWAVQPLNRVSMLPTWPRMTLRGVRTLDLECHKVLVEVRITSSHPYHKERVV